MLFKWFGVLVARVWFVVRDGTGAAGDGQYLPMHGPSYLAASLVAWIGQDWIGEGGRMREGAHVSAIARFA